MDITLLDEPVSTANPKLTAAVNERISHDEVIVLLIRYAYTGGGKEYHIIRSAEEFVSFLGELPPQTSVTTFFESAFSAKGKVDAKLYLQMIELFAKEYEEHEGMNFLCLESTENVSDGRKIAFIHETESVRQWLSLHDGCRVLIGTMKFWLANNKDFVTAYVPDKDGKIHPGAY